MADFSPTNTLLLLTSDYANKGKHQKPPSFEKKAKIFLGFDFPTWQRLFVQANETFDVPGFKALISALAAQAHSAHIARLRKLPAGIDLHHASTREPKVMSRSFETPAGRRGNRRHPQ